MANVAAAVQGVTVEQTKDIKSSSLENIELSDKKLDLDAITILLSYRITQLKRLMEPVPIKATSN